MGEGSEFDSKGKGGVEASLDDFFQPSTQESSKKGAKPGKAGKPPKKAENELPIEKSRVGELKDEPEEAAPAEAAVEEPEKGKEKKKAKEKKPKKVKAAGASSSKTTIIVIGVVAAFLVAGAGAGYFAYTKFLAKPEEVTITKPATKPPATVAKPVTPPPKPVATATKPAPAKPGAPAAAPGQLLKPAAPAAPAAAPKPGTTPAPATAITAKPGTAAAPKPVAAPLPKPKTPPTAPAIPVKPVKPAVAPAKPTPATPTSKPAAAPAKPAPARTAQAPAKPAASGPVAIPLPSYAPGRGWSCQVGAYMLRESLDEPLATVKSLGYNNLYYIDTNRTLKIYHLYLKGDFEPAQAASKMTALRGIGFKPRLENAGAKQRVIAYSYGKNSIALSSKSKIEKAALGPAEIVPRTENVTLHQLRIGPFATRAEAARAVQGLRQKGLAPALVEER